MASTTKRNSIVDEIIAGSDPSPTSITVVENAGIPNNGDAGRLRIFIHVRDDGSPADYFAAEYAFVITRSGGLNFNGTTLGLDNNLTFSTPPAVSASGSDLVVTATYSGDYRWKITAEFETID